MSDCLFCKIGEGKIPASKVYEDDQFFCIKDIQPEAKIHLLVMPRKHIASLDTAFPEQGESHQKLIGDLFATAAKIARAQGLMPGGYRAILNTNSNAGQTVFHLHLHLLGGEQLSGH